MKKHILTIWALLLCCNALFSQGQLDAYNYAKSDLIGTARYMSMGGAFGALGGDISVMSANPAGLGVYRSSEIAGTLSVNSVQASTSGWDQSINSRNTNFKMNNFGAVFYFPTASSSGVIGWNLGISYHHLKDFNRTYKALGRGGNHSISDYMAERANRAGYHRDDLEWTNSYDPYSNREISDWLTILAYNAVLIDAPKDPYSYHSAFGDYDAGKDSWADYQLNQRELVIRESGAIDQYNFAFGMNVSNFLFLGADLAITNIDYNLHSFYREDFEQNNYLDLENNLRTEARGYQFNAGVILRPVDFLRFGVAYNSPTWFSKMSDVYSATANSDTYYWSEPVTASAPNSEYPGVFDYKLHSHDKWIFSAAAIIGQTALLSVDYELANYQRMKLYYTDGIANQATNDEISNNFTSASTLRVGAEVKITPQFAIRAGAAIAATPIKLGLQNGSTEVFTVGTIPHYATGGDVTNYTAGLGYRFSPNFYLDLACVLTSQKENVYAFSNLYNNAGGILVESHPINLKTESTRIAVTLGYKF
ncbi:MAG: hypothetical protein LBD28_01925 [Tannerellaceae bacterium]|nr:hypothetical protein [Tannerellaceae bacterium]